ncbi:MAG: carboxypeptidase-like regulatory domain-containing protein, partial [Pyrinomonadaceae bacterium]
MEKTEAPAPDAAAETGQWSVSGRIFFSHGRPAGGLTIHLYHRSYGCAETPLGQTTTGADGSYFISYMPAATPTHLEVRAANDKESKEGEVSLSAVRYNAGPREVFNLVAPVGLRRVAPEYERLKADLERHLGREASLAKAHEGAACQDISLLHRATNWDARLIALLALAARRVAETRMEEAALYALFRCGLPTNARLLAHASQTAVAGALKKAVEANIVGLSNAQITAAKAAFRKFARAARRATKASGAASSFAELLQRGGLSRSEEVVFENLYFEHRGTADELWRAAEKKGISRDKIESLQLQGKLAYLTLNNAGLTEALQREIGRAEDLGALADKGLYSEEAWAKLLLDMAKGKEPALRKLIPTAYKGEKLDDR